jgi:hypothetical protein
MTPGGWLAMLAVLALLGGLLLMLGGQAVRRRRGLGAAADGDAG